MSVVTREFLLKQLRWRYATKKFDPTRTIPETDWKVLEEVMILTPSSFGLQPWKFFVVVDPKVKAKLPAESWGQMQVQDASHTVVLAVRKEVNAEFVDQFFTRVAEVRGSANEDMKKRILGYAAKLSPEEIIHWNTRQVYIALGSLMTAAALLGIDSCPMEGFNPDRYDEILGIGPLGFRSIVVCALGYRSPEDKYSSIPKVRFEAKDVVQYI